MNVHTRRRAHVPRQRDLVVKPMPQPAGVPGFDMDHLPVRRRSTAHDDCEVWNVEKTIQYPVTRSVLGPNKSTTIMTRYLFFYRNKIDTEEQISNPSSTDCAALCSDRSCTTTMHIFTRGKSHQQININS